jgi:hypothetical protein
VSFPKGVEPRGTREVFFLKFFLDSHPIRPPELSDSVTRPAGTGSWISIRAGMGAIRYGIPDPTQEYTHGTRYDCFHSTRYFTTAVTFVPKHEYGTAWRVTPAWTHGIFRVSEWSQSCEVVIRRLVLRLSALPRPHNLTRRRQRLKYSSLLLSSEHVVTF